MDPPPTLENVIHATRALYHNPDNSEKDRASAWLQDFQHSVYAWQICDQLLQLKQDVESCYIAAQTMRTKIQYYFDELPVESHSSLRDSLVNHIESLTGAQYQIISTQLCLALADLALQMVHWRNSAGFLIQKLSGNTAYIPALLELLTVLPEEVHSRHLRLGMNRREEFKMELADNSSTVLSLLTACTESSGGDVRLLCKVFKCLASWFSLGIMPSEESSQSKLVALNFEILKNPESSSMLHEAASDSLVAALFGMQDIDDHMALATTVYRGIMELSSAYHLSVAQEDVDKCINYCRIFTELAEAVMEVMVETPGSGLGDLKVLDAVLECIGGDQRELADITFNFWYRLSEVLYQRDARILNDVFRPYVQRLVHSLCKHCQIEADKEGVPDEKDDFGDFRSKVTELVKDIIFIVGSSTCFKDLFQILASQDSPPWYITEASLFVMTAVAKNVLPDENTVVPLVVQAICSLPENTHIAVRYTGIRMIGELAEWIHEHPDYIDPCLHILTSGLRNHELASVAATSISKICEENRDHLHNHFEGLLNIARAVDAFSLTSEAAVGLVQAAAVVLGRLPLDQIPQGLNQLVAAQVTPLSKIVDSNGSKPDVTKDTDPCKWLDRLAAIFRHTNPRINGQAHPCATTLLDIWPVLSNTLNKYQTDVKIVERWCRCLRFAIRCVGKSSSALLTPLVTQMVEIYSTRQHSCFLYLGSVLVDEYGRDSSCSQGLLSMLEAFIVPTYKLLEEENGFRNHPDTLDDFFRLGVRFLQRCPVAFINHSTMKSILQCGVAGIKIDHRDANGSIAKFFIELIKCGSEKWESSDFQEQKRIVSKILNENGEVLVKAILDACVFHIPTFMVPDQSEVLFEMIKMDRTSLCKWMDSALKSLPVSSTGTIGATSEQINQFLEKIARAEEDVQVSYALRDFSRLFR